MMRTLYIILLYCCLSVFGALNGNAQQVSYTKEDSLIYESYINKYIELKNKPINQIIVATANHFIGSPYVGSTLETSDNEALVVNLRQFDCTTFVENCIALSKVVKSGDPSFANYCHILSNIRYRNGVIDGYLSRLHYTTDWIWQNQQSGLLKDITSDLGGKVVDKRIDFMSSHSVLYPRLKDNGQDIAKLKEYESVISDRKTYSVLAVNDITRVQNIIQDGDIIAFATSVGGLDYSHVGIAYSVNGQLRFIHASSSSQKVVLNNTTLVSYCLKSAKCSGVSILRISNN